MAADVTEYTLTTDQARRRCGVPGSTLRDHAQSGRLPALKVGSRWRFRPADIEAYTRGDTPRPGDRAPAGGATVGQLIQWLGQFPKDTPVGFDLRVNIGALPNVG